MGAKWKQLSEEKIRYFWYNSLTKKDFAEKIGYKSAGHIQEILDYYNIKNDDLGKDNPNKKKYCIGPR